MALNKKVLAALRKRDDHCWHCGVEYDLVPHHRINRGMGGSKLLDTLDNLILVCARWNGEMESNATAAASARGWGHKLPVWEKLKHPVFDRMGGWWYLHPDGTKTGVNDIPF